MKTHVKSRDADDDRGMHLFLHRGSVQLHEQNGNVGMLIARGEHAARTIAAKKNATGANRISPALIGSVEGETLEGHIAASIQDGHQGAWMTNDGELIHWFEFGGVC